MRVSEAMKRDVYVARPDHSIEDAARVMLAIDVGILPVEEGDRVVGMISDRDIAVRAVAEGKKARTPIGEVMTRDVRCCFEDEDTSEVERAMGEQQVRRMPVLNRDERLVGILSLADLAQRDERVGAALRRITRPGGAHTQGAEQRHGGM
jgi:CBS domain-containing protein